MVYIDVLNAAGNIKEGSESMKEYICIPKEEYVRLLKTFTDLESIIKDLRATARKKKATFIDIEEAQP